MKILPTRRSSFPKVHSFDNREQPFFLYRVIPEAGAAAENSSNVRKIIFCSGKVYYDLKKTRTDQGLDSEIAITRIEQLSPFPFDLIKKECHKYPNAQIVLAQEEHKNQGPWTYIQTRFQTTLNGSRPVSYVGRPTAASPSTGSKMQHLRELNALLQDAMH